MEASRRGDAATSSVAVEARSPEELCACIVGAVRAAAGAERSLRRVWALLSRDLLAVLSGMRPAVMLDYVSVAPTVIQSLLDALGISTAGAANALPDQSGKCLSEWSYRTTGDSCDLHLLPSAGKQLMVGEWDACLYIVRADLVLERAQQANRVRWMTFCETTSGFTCSWAKAEEAQVVLPPSLW